jgi:putative Holliday junction resolvase
VLGVDLGSRRIGLALSDPSRTIASPLVVLTRSKDPVADRRAIVHEARQAEVALMVVGLPLSLDGSDGPAARAARLEVRELALVAGDDLPVVLHDERLTTISAERSLAEANVPRDERRRVVDKVAAAVMLQAFLDAQSGGGS